MEIFEQLESEVRSYCRSFPAVFTRACGTSVWDETGREYLDFFSGAGALNYGHNDPTLKRELVRYIEEDGIAHGLDMSTGAKGRFLELFQRHILEPRNLDFRIMFPGPTGTNAVEAAMKLARKVTGRTNIVAFTNAFHGMTMGALAATGNNSKRNGAAAPLASVSHMPFDGYFGPDTDTAEYLEALLADPSSGIDPPAAILVETVQAEGGINVASSIWLRDVQRIAHRCGALLIVDDIQAGCGRTGDFFSFERAGLDPDIVCLSKSLSGYGLPMSVALIRPSLDSWAPGEHNGTFRGNNHAFVTATAAIENYWQDEQFSRQVKDNSAILAELLESVGEEFDATVRGRGHLMGIAFEDPNIAQQVSRRAFDEGLIIETSGAKDEVLKFLPPLITSQDELRSGVEIVRHCLKAETGRPAKRTSTSVSRGAAAR